jgi:hypothetical protein
MHIENIDFNSKQRTFFGTGLKGTSKNLQIYNGLPKT